MNDTYLSLADVCQKLGVSESTFRKILADPETKFPTAYGVHKSRRWSQIEIDQWAKANKQPN